MAGTRSSTGPSGADAPRGAEHELLAHTAEVKLRVRAADFPALAGEAGRALAALELGGEVPPATGEAREIVVRAGDQGALLVDWLNELIYLAETERWVATEFVPQAGGPLELRMRARGATVDTAPSRVKAATHHGLDVRTTADGVEAEVVFDV
ncbi:MAG TPA: archease [Gemmatimonadales bacterium]|nr:archease [Gemmatimonadales bacterium]